MPFRCVVSEHVSATPEKIFAVATDFTNAAGRISGIKKMEVLTDGPVGLGTRFRETRVMWGKEASETMEVVEFNPGRSYTLAANSCGCEYRAVMNVEHAGPGGGSRVTFDFTGTPQTFGAKVMSAVMGWMMKGTLVKAMRQDLLDLKAAVEKG